MIYSIDINFMAYCVTLPAGLWQALSIVSTFRALFLWCAPIMLLINIHLMGQFSCK